MKNKSDYIIGVLFCVLGSLSFGTLIYYLMWSVSYMSLTKQYILWSIIIAILFGAFFNEFYFHLSYAFGLTNKNTNKSKNVTGNQEMKKIIVKDAQGMSENEVYDDIYIDNVKNLVKNISETEDYKAIINELDKTINSKYPDDKVVVSVPDKPVDILFALRCNGFYAEIIDDHLYVEIKHWNSVWQKYTIYGILFYIKRKKEYRMKIDYDSNIKNECDLKLGDVICDINDVFYLVSEVNSYDKLFYTLIDLEDGTSFGCADTISELQQDFYDKGDKILNGTFKYVNDKN